MKEVIPHGIPESPYFEIAVPPSWANISIDRDPEHPEVIELEDPKTKLKTKVEVIDITTMTLDEFIAHNAVCLKNYGLPAAKVAYALQQTHQEIALKQMVRYVLLRKITE